MTVMDVCSLCALCAVAISPMRFVGDLIAAAISECIGGHGSKPAGRLRYWTHFGLATAKLSKCLIMLALPREAREVSKFNDLRKSLGRGCLIGFQSVSAAPPKP